MPNKETLQFLARTEYPEFCVEWSSLRRKTKRKYWNIEFFCRWTILPNTRTPGSCIKLLSRWEVVRTDCVCKRGNKVLGKSQATEGKDWYDDECREQVSKRTAAEKTLPGLHNWNRLRYCKKELMKLKPGENYRVINRPFNLLFFKRKRSEYLNEMVEEIQTTSERKDPRTMYRTVK